MAPAKGQRGSGRSRRRTDGHPTATKDLQSDLAPATFERLEVDASVDERLCEITSSGL